MEAVIYAGNHEIRKYTNRAKFLELCEDIQIWHKHDYGVNLLRDELAFPLLKNLTESGDAVAKKALKKLIRTRLLSGDPNEIQILCEERYTNYLTYNELYHLKWNSLFQALTVSINQTFEATISRNNEKAMSYASTIIELLFKFNKLQSYLESEFEKFNNDLYCELLSIVFLSSRSFASHLIEELTNYLIRFCSKVDLEVLTEKLSIFIYLFRTEFDDIEQPTIAAAVEDIITFRNFFVPKQWIELVFNFLSKEINYSEFLALLDIFSEEDLLQAIISTYHNTDKFLKFYRAIVPLYERLSPSGRATAKNLFLERLSEEQLDEILNIPDQDEKFDALSSLIDEIKGSTLIKQHFTKLLTATKDFRESKQREAFSALINAIKNAGMTEEIFSELLNWLDIFPEDYQYQSFSTLMDAIKGTELMRKHFSNLLNWLESLEDPPEGVFFDLFLDLIDTLEQLDLHGQYDVLSELIKAIKETNAYKDFSTQLEGIKGTDLTKNNAIINNRHPLLEKSFTNLIILLDNLPDYFKSSAFCELIEPSKGIELLKLIKKEFPEFSNRLEEILKKEVNS